MGWLPLYLIEQDVEFLNDWLNQEEDIAFLVSNGPSKWIAKKQYNIMSDVQVQKEEGNINNIYLEYSLWHIPSVPLPLFGSSPNKIKFNSADWNEETIEDPWKGWTEIKGGVNASMPYFGAGHPGIIRLTIQLSNNSEIPMSDFQWIGNHYRILGSGAEKSTEKFWSKLRRMAKKIGTHIPRENRVNEKNEIYAFPLAFQAIKNGRTCSKN